MLEELGHEGVLVLVPNVELLDRVVTRVPRESLYALTTRHLDEGEARAEQRLRARARELEVGIVGTVEVLYHDRVKRPLQDVLSCIRRGVTVHTAGRWVRGNAEHALLGPDAMAQRFADAPELLEASLAIEDRCRFDLSAIRYRYPTERLPTGESEQSWLRGLTLRGAQKRYANAIPDDVASHLERELGVIEALDYGGYFLTMHEIVEWCRERDILCQGRGSAANSIVCYCLGITAIDPIRMDLLFERFLSLERAEPPDIDLDIEHERREEVIQHVY
jgi:error-prone DNA polymerase